MRARMPLFVGLLAVAGCASASHSPRVQSGSLCTVSAEELRHSTATSLYDALREVRPSLFRSNIHGEGPIVVLDGVVVSTEAVTFLRSVPVSEIYSVRRLSASAATQRYGLHQTNAVLEVLTLHAMNQDPESRESGCS